MSGKAPTVERVEKPWGYELIWARTPQYVGKILFIKAGESLSLQFHNQKVETIFVETGELVFQHGPSADSLTTLTLKSGDSFHIAPRCVHRMTGKTDCRIFEVSTAQLDDVVRLEDRYGRIP